MALVYQLDLFEPQETSELRFRMNNIEKESGKIKKTNDNVRKGMFARHGKIEKRMMELESRLEIIEKGLCQTKE